MKRKIVKKCILTAITWIMEYSFKEKFWIKKILQRKFYFYNLPKDTTDSYNYITISLIFVVSKYINKRTLSINIIKMFIMNFSWTKWWKIHFSKRETVNWKQPYEIICRKYVKMLKGKNNMKWKVVQLIPFWEMIIVTHFAGW